jgi:hypothetical protein
VRSSARTGRFHACKRGTADGGRSPSHRWLGSIENVARFATSLRRQPYNHPRLSASRMASVRLRTPVFVMAADR